MRTRKVAAAKVASSMPMKVADTATATVVGTALPRTWSSEARLLRDVAVSGWLAPNTSSKIVEKDPLSGADTPVLWVKGSGGDLRTSKRENFSSLYQDKLIGLQSVYAARADKGDFMHVCSLVEWRSNDSGTFMLPLLPISAAG